MVRSRRLVTQHFEKVSWRVMQDYPEKVRAMIRDQSGIYALYNRDSLYYVGLANNLMRRLQKHLKDRHCIALRNGEGTPRKRGRY